MINFNLNDIVTSDFLNYKSLVMLCISVNYE